MTGNSEGDRIISAGPTDRPERLGTRNATGQLREREWSTRWNGAERLPDLALKRRAANIEGDVEPVARRRQKPLNPGYVFFHGALIADEHRIRNDLPQFDFQFFRVRAQQDSAHSHPTAGNEDFTEIAARDGKLNRLGCVDRRIFEVRGGDDVHLISHEIRVIRVKTEQGIFTPILLFKSGIADWKAGIGKYVLPSPGRTTVCHQTFDIARHRPSARNDGAAPRRLPASRRSFPVEQHFLALNTPGVSGQRPIIADHSVAGNCHREIVGCTGTSDSTYRLGRPDPS